MDGHRVLLFYDVRMIFLFVLIPKAKQYSKLPQFGDLGFDVHIKRENLNEIIKIDYIKFLITQEENYNQDVKVYDYKMKVD